MEMDRTENVLNSAGHPHGAAITALIDYTGGHAVHAALGYTGPTVDLQVRFLMAPDGSPIRADARILRAGQRLAVVEVRVYGQSGGLAAIGTLTTAPIKGAPTDS
jgi:uncharacterized protein (TIGR00369 family)